MTEDLLRRLAADVSVVPGGAFAPGVRRRARTLARRRVATRAGVVAGVVAVGGGGAALVAVAGGSSRPGPAITAAPSSLVSPPAQASADRAAILAAADDRAIASAPYWYVASRQVDAQGQRELHSWLRRDGIETLVTAAQPVATSLHSVLPAYGGRQLTWGSLATLPSGPATLLDPTRLLAAPADSTVAPAGSAFEALTRLAVLPLPGAQRRAVVAAIISAPGVRDEGPARDDIGRAGLALRRGSVRVVLGDAGRLLEVDDGSSSTTYLAQGPVQSLTERLPVVAPSPGASPLTPTPVVPMPLPSGVSAGPPSPCAAGLATLERLPAPAVTPRPLECRVLTRRAPSASATP